jgi:hypothetical protein
MREIPLLFIALVIAVFVGGCMTPGNVAKEVPGVLSNVSNDIGNATGQAEDNLSQMVNPQPTFAPLVTSPAYVAPAQAVIVATTTTESANDLIVGTWYLMGDQKPADCTAVVNPDNTGYLICAAGPVELAEKDFRWYPIDSTTGVTDSYTINLTTGQNYTAQYSERNGWITSDVLPPGTDLERRT